MVENLLTQIIKLWVSIGIYDVILPFVFIFTIVYATLEKTRLFGGYKNINAMVAFCIGFIATASIATVEGIQKFFVATGFFMIVGLCIMILASMFGITSIAGKGNKWYDKMPRLIIVVIVGVGILYMLSIAFGFNRILASLVPNISSTIVQSVIVGAIFVLIMWFIVRSPGSKENSSSKSSSGSSEANTTAQSEQKKNNKSGNTLVDKGNFKQSFEKNFP